MKLYYINQLLHGLPEFERLLKSLHDKQRKRVRLSLPDQAAPLVAAAIYGRLNRTVLFVTAHAEAARRRFEQIKLWLPDTVMPLFFPEADLLGNGSPDDPVIKSERIKVISLLAGCNSAAESEQSSSFIMCCAAALIRRSIGRDSYRSGCIQIINGMSINQSTFLEKLQSVGYKYEDIVEIPGSFSKRGGIIDVFPCGHDSPARIEFFGNEINSLRLYDARSQRSMEKVPVLFIPPAGEMSNKGTANLLDYLPGDAILVLDDIQQIESEVERIMAEFSSPEQSPAGEVGRAAVGFEWEAIENKIRGRDRVVEFSRWDETAEQDEQHYRLPIRGAPDFSAKFAAFLDRLSELRRESGRVLIVSQQAERISELLQERDISIDVIRTLGGLPVSNSIVLMQGLLDGGWQLDNELLLLTDAELFGNIKRRRLAKTRPVRHHLFLNDINVGDAVVHVEHGIGRFAGTIRKISAGVEREYLMLEYACGDMLYVPVDQVDRVSLYIGGSEKTPSLNRLGSQEWIRAQQRVKESVANIAGELIELYAGRAAGGGIAFSRDTLWQKELEASFPYVETPDQMEAIEAVKADMESARPMDRLVCGDVGYGKTEIALRASFKAVMDSKQVAIMVPTTILAQQHMSTFSDRLKTFPVKVAVLSRFCSAGEQADVIAGLAEGTVDICIGTHRMLQKDVRFKDLGLVIIDEEQRFGVVHKEHFKKMRQSVDVLTLSATPIPRTMHMALSGIRDMSTIETPPESRLPVITYVGEYNDRLVREALLRELERDGQAFLVHNRVHSINDLASKVAGQTPEARIAVAHGQMEEDKLEDIMSEFMLGKSDVLVTTTIIESGLDMPNVNTLIVDNADKMGLTQLYQLRGRVGRGANSAYAYFLFDSGKGLTDQAIERLKVIARATELGAGYAIAMKDLEIRGAGNLLGVEQSGNIAAVGFSYYCQLLEEAVEEIKARREGRILPKKVEPASVTIDLKLPAFIPDHYIENTRTRFNIYHRLARIVTAQEVCDISEELIDRFGDMPEEVTNLLYVVELRQSAIAAGIESVVRDGDNITVSCGDREIKDTDGIDALRNRAVRRGNRQIKIDIETAGHRWMKLLKELVLQLSCAGISTTGEKGA
ncbi:MAG: transcription-repair coupling factor [Dehalococcoidia bacterium]|nr:transcription-repair coupling factor [Dehalococcoidia bacterium]